jgi:uncharacterized RDD family membrane protein YckC
MISMSIETTRTELRYARPKQRAYAFMFDFLIIVGYILILLVIGVGINFLSGGLALLTSPIAMNVVAFVVLVLPVILYFALQESSPQQATWGKRRAKIRVTTVQGARMSVWQSLLRSAIKFLPWQLAHISVIYIWYGSQSTIFLIGSVIAQALVIVYIMCLWLSKRHRTPYDWMAGTLVVAVK